MSDELPQASGLNSPIELSICPSCSAAVPTNTKQCWLCKWDLAEEIVTAEVIGRPPRYLKPSGTRDALIAGIVSLAIATVGVFAVAPGIGVLLAVVFVIASFAVAKALQSEDPTLVEVPPIVQAYASPTAPLGAKPSSSVAAEVFKILGIVILLGIASVIAFFTFCVICVMVIANA